MPRKKKVQQKQKQKQKQSQRVVVNVGTIAKSKKRSGRGGLPPPSHMHNLAPTFVTAPQVDYTPLIAMMQHHARPIVAQSPMPVTQTPLSATIQASTAEVPVNKIEIKKISGEALRRAGPTAKGFQPPPSLSDERLAREIQSADDVEAERELKLKQTPRVAEARPKLGRPFKPEKLTIGEPVTGDLIPSAFRQSTNVLSDVIRIPNPRFKQQKERRQMGEEDVNVF